MTKSKFLRKRDEIANALGLCVLGFVDYCAPYEDRGEKAPQADYDRFRKAYNLIVGKYVKLCRRAGYVGEDSYNGNEDDEN